MFSFSSSAFLLLAALTVQSTTAEYLRESAQRLRHFDNQDPSTFQLSVQNPEAAKLFGAIAADPNAIDPDQVAQTGQDIEEQTAADEEAFQGLLDSILKIGERSMPSTEAPSITPSTIPTLAPTTRVPSTTGYPTDMPSASPSSEPTPTPSAHPSASPTISTAPSVNEQTPAPTDGQTSSPTASPTTRPSLRPTTAPTTLSPTERPSVNPTVSVQPSVAPSSSPTSTPTSGSPSFTPTTANCRISSQQRVTELLALLDSVANSTDIRNPNLPQGQATEWFLNQDGAEICPDDPKVLQRWILAVIYFSTQGDGWLQCSANPSATDNCGAEEPFVAATRFLSSVNECEWAGISCIDDCITEIEFEENALNGTIPTEIGLLSDLAIWGMERGNLSSTIPTEIGLLSNLIFLDLDFNQLTGSLPAELLTLSELTQLDLNNNQLTGSINGIGVFPAMEFLQLHDNFFTGTVPSAVGTFSRLAAFTLHETLISGSMPAEVCDLLSPPGILTSLIADCGGQVPDIICPCCTDCRVV